MACLHPLPAWRTAGGVTLKEPLSADDRTDHLRLPCGGCLGCRMDKSRDWAVRCQLELKDHSAACWATLTYAEKYVPPTLQKDHLSGWLKRLRSRLSGTRIRFFASGEYGETTNRPHYHVILYGLSAHPAIEDTWAPRGHVRVDPLTPAAIGYVAGYCSKKVGWKQQRGERVDPDTGELFDYQPPFILMSRNPGIASNAKEHWHSWRETAIHHGREVPVPRYLHEAWKQNASPSAVEALDAKREQRSRDKNESIRANGGFTLNYEADRLKAAAAIAIAKHQRTSEKRSL